MRALTLGRQGGRAHELLRTGAGQARQHPDCGLPAGAHLLASFIIALQRGGKGSHWRAEQEKEE